MKKVTIKDIAEGAGVSISTVSYVLSGKRSVSDEVKRRIHEQIELLNYKPNAVARSFASRKTNIIGLYCSKYPDTENTDVFFLKMVNGMMAAAEKRNYKVLLLNEMEGSENFVIPFDKTFPIDGAIVTTTINSHRYLNQLESEEMPFVLVGKPPKDLKINCIDNDNVKAAYEAVELLLKQGATNIGMVTGSGLHTRLSDFEIGYMMAHNSYQIAYRSENIIRHDINDPDYVQKIMTAIQENGLDGLLVSLLFTRLINRLLTDPHAPQSIPIVTFGFDLIAEHYSHLAKDVHYIQSNAYKLGIEAVARLIDLIDKPESKAKQMLLSPVLSVWRQSKELQQIE